MTDLVSEAHDWWKSEGGLLVNYGKLFCQATLNGAIGDRDFSPRPLMIGPNSLVADVLGDNSVETLVENLSAFVPKYATELTDGFRHASEHFEPVWDTHRVEGETTVGPLDCRYQKIILPVKTIAGATFMMSFSQRYTVH